MQEFFQAHILVPTSPADGLRSICQVLAVKGTKALPEGAIVQIFPCLSPVLIAHRDQLGGGAGHLTAAKSQRNCGPYFQVLEVIELVSDLYLPCYLGMGRQLSSMQLNYHELALTRQDLDGIRSDFEPRLPGLESNLNTTTPGILQLQIQSLLLVGVYRPKVEHSCTEAQNRPGQPGGKDVEKFLQPHVLIASSLTDSFRFVR